MKIVIVYEVPTARGNWKRQVTVYTFEEAELMCKDIESYGYHILSVMDVLDEYPSDDGSPVNCRNTP